MSENPWLRLPTEPPYVLPEDREAVESFNRTASPECYLHVDKLLPEAFVGPKDAPVVLLSNNPGFSERTEGTSPRLSPYFMDMIRKNLRHESLDYPFLFLHPDFIKGGNVWWKQKLKQPLARFGDKAVARSVLNVVFFPYPSCRFGHSGFRLRSRAQSYGFDLVRAAVKRRAVIVSMRPGRNLDWLKEVTELRGYDHFFSVNNPQTPAISPNNLGEANYQAVESAIEAFVNGRRV